MLNVLRLLSDENTIPFIARYRKEQTGSLTEVEIKAIADAREREDAKEKTRGRILRAIDDLLLSLSQTTKKTTTADAEGQRREKKKIEETRGKIERSESAREMEDLWQTIKPDGKTNTRAAKARERGLEPLAEMIARRDWNVIARAREDRKRLGETDEEEIWKGARDILSEWVGNESAVRECAKEQMGRFGRVTCAKVSSSQASKKTKKKDGEDEDGAKSTKNRFDMLTPKERREQKAMESAERYDNFSASVMHVKPHQILAMNRAEANGTLRVKLELDYARQVVPAAERFCARLKIRGAREVTPNNIDTTKFAKTK